MSSVRDVQCCVCAVRACTVRHQAREGHLVAHVQESAESEAEGVALVVADKVAHILQQPVTGSVEVSVCQVGHHHRVLDHAPVALVETVHSTVPLHACTTRFLAVTEHTCSLILTQERVCNISVVSTIFLHREKSAALHLSSGIAVQSRQCTSWQVEAAPGREGHRR